MTRSRSGRTLSALAILVSTAAATTAADLPRLGTSPTGDVVAAMTREEKVALVVGAGMRRPGMPPEMQGPVVGETAEGVPGAAGTTVPISRLGIPAIVLADGPAGLRIQPKREGDTEHAYYCTAFPIETLLASSWDTDLVEQVGRAMGDEVRDYGVDVLLGPALNVHRNPLGGRNFEYYSEDPLVTGQMAAAMVRGVQSQGVGTSIKHFVANNHEWDRNVINVKVSERALREIYLRGFEIAVREARPWTVMSSYNKVNGTYTSESPDLLTRILRDQWGFDGLVMTDWFGGRDAVAQMKAGNDLLMPGTAGQQRALLAALESGTLSEEVLDRNVTRILEIIRRSPSFLKIPHSDAPDLKAHARVARDAAAQGMVLLQNGGTLPLHAPAKLALFGNTSYRMITGGTGSGDVNEAYTVSLVDGLEAAGFAVDPALADAYDGYIVAAEKKQPAPRRFFERRPPIPERVVSPEEIARASREADVALFTLGRNAGEGRDREVEGDFELTAVEKALIHDLAAAFHSRKKTLVVVLNIGGVIETASWRDEPDAILLAWQPGQETGHAIADVLAGKTPPSGKLATTFPMKWEDVPSSANFPGTVLEGPDPTAPPSPFRRDRAAEVEYTDGVFVGYRHFVTRGVKTAYPFGFGLSYTRFEYSDLTLSGTELDDALTARVTVKNAGSAAGREVVQLYVSAPGKDLPKPAIELRAFGKTRTLQPGESETLSFTLTARDLASFDEASSSWRVEPGAYAVKVGASSEDVRQTATFTKAEEETAASALLPFAFLDTSLPTDRRVDDLVSRMTLEEKASQLVNRTRAIPRLGVPEYNLWSEALHGVANNGGVTVFPQAIGLGATFDAPLLKRMAEATALEARVKWNLATRSGQAGRIFRGLTFFSPNINIFRDPRWGRGQETYGEDPYLTGKLGVAFITGLQGDPDHPTATATAKHYAVHSGPEPLRHGFDAVASSHDLEDTYLPAFRAAVVDGKVKSVMCVYNAVNGVPGCASEFLLDGTLREHWGFQGFVTGDCDAVRDIETGHEYVKTAAEAGAVAIEAGLDSDCTTSSLGFGSRATPDYQRYLDALHQGLLSEADVDVALKRMLRTRFQLGLFDPPQTVKAARVDDSELDSAAHRELALELARESMVLLKNDGLLPFAKAPARIAVVGPLADSARVLLGNYNGYPSRSTTALDGIRTQFPEATVVFEPGTKFLRPVPLVPTSALTTEAGGPGLEAEVFANAEMSGAPVETRTDSQIALGPDRSAFFSSDAPRTPGRPTRWTGWLTPEESGTYRLGVEGWGNRLFLDGEKLVDTTGGFPPPPNTTEVTLERGHRYAIRIEAVPRFFASTRLVWMPPMADIETRAVAAAREADVVVAVVGITSDLEGEESGVDQPGFKGGDRTSLDLPREERQLLEAVQATGKPLVVVVMSGSAIALNWSKEHANAILQAWYPGEEGGTAIAETLAGAHNPAGRLPVTLYTGTDQLPEFTDYSMANRTYRYFTGTPLYPFGYGLSYSTFAYSGLHLAKEEIAAGEPLEVAVDVENTSDQDGDEVVQAYLLFPGLPGAPSLALRGFSRVHLKAGESRTVRLTLTERDLSHVDEAGTRVVAAGRYQISVGGGQPGTDAPTAEADFSITGRKELPR
ncbi:MAG: glycoside hydrolase family 3 C-terminal domain-containing protein [Acidobacteria bacterium]|nr:glycoside hydrolase family 3 C-terminal domain-containing protein [Acidobacteriota bacterium]